MKFNVQHDTNLTDVNVWHFILNYLFSYSTVGCTIALSLLMALPIAMVIMGKLMKGIFVHPFSYMFY